MIVLKRVLQVIWVVSLGTLIFTYFNRNNLPPQAEIDRHLLQQPIQTELADIQKKDIELSSGGFDYKITPKYNYELWGLVVSRYDSTNWFDFYHKKDPFNIGDVCVVWDQNIRTGVYEQMKYTHGEFTCTLSFKKDIASTWFAKFDHSADSNNHLLPANNEIAAKIKKTAVGDQIHFKGYLVDYKIYQNGQLSSTRSTSITRTDTSGSNCEVVYVTDYEILKPGNILYRNLFKWSLYGLISTSVFLFGLVLAGK